MATAHWAAAAATGHAAGPEAAPAPRATLWQTVQFALLLSVTLALIRTSGVFAALPDITASDRWQIFLEILCARFADVVCQLAVLHAVALPAAAPRAMHVLRFAAMVLLGTAGSTAPLILLADPASIRLGLIESATTGLWNSLFLALLMAIFLVYQHNGQVRNEETSRRLQQLQRGQQAARRRLVEAQLQAMQARVDPQMFFDVLDCVQRLYPRDAPRAEVLLDELIVFLRAALPRLRGASSTLAQELELAGSYFRLQKLRGGAPTAVRVSLPEALAERAFPAGVILPLLSGLRTAAIQVEEKPGIGATNLTVSVHADRAPDPRVLAQVRATLAALYGSAASVECRQVTDDHTETRMTIAHAAP